MSQKLSIKGFKWVEKLSKFNERFIKSYNENSDKGYFLEVDVEYARKLRFLHKDFPFSPERKKVGKVEKLVCDVENKIYIYICYSYKSLKTRTKSWTSTKKNTLSNSI